MSTRQIHTYKLGNQMEERFGDVDEGDGASDDGDRCRGLPDYSGDEDGSLLRIPSGGQVFQTVFVIAAALPVFSKIRRQRVKVLDETVVLEAVRWWVQSDATVPVLIK